MPFKPFAHLVRIAGTKGLTHGAAPTILAANQSLNQFHNYPVSKLTKASQLQNTFNNASGSGAGAGAKTGNATQGGNGDAGLGQYYAAWQHAQQTGDDTEWKQHQTARSIGWKSQEKGAHSKQLHRLESSRAIELLRPTARLHGNRAYSENTAHDVRNADALFTEAEALARVDEAIAQEIKDRAAQAAGAIVQDESVVAAQEQSEDVDEFAVESVDESLDHTASTALTSPNIHESTVLSSQIVTLGEQQRYAEIPALFESIIKQGLVPTTQAYNHILLSAINLVSGYQPWPRALEVYGDMTKRQVQLDNTTYSILLQFLAGRSLAVQNLQADLTLRQTRYGSFVFPSTTQQHQLYSADSSLVFAAKLYNIARATLEDFTLSASVYNAMVETCAKAGLTETVVTLLKDMKAKQIALQPALYTVVIDAFALAKNVDAAQRSYEEYRDLAISRAANDMLDMHVYAALMKAYLTCGHKDTAIYFYKKILQSFDGSSEQGLLSEQLTGSFILRSLIQHNVESKSFDSVIAEINDYDMSLDLKDQAMAKICMAAADSENAMVAADAFATISPAYTKAEPAMALASMHLRRDNVAEAKAVWDKFRTTPMAGQATTDFVAMYTMAMIHEGAAEAAVGDARSMFQEIRSASSKTGQNVLSSEIDEGIILFGQALMQSHAIVSAQTSMALLRMMIENGGLVSPVAEHAIASLGPECVHQLNAQDIALALHVQAQMLPTQSSKDFDAAHVARFSHLLETVLNRGVLMDPSTVHIVTEALPRLGSARPDLVQRWQELLRPAPSTPALSQVLSPTSAQSFMSSAPLSDAYDPYAHTTDHRASKAISDLLESTTGRPETNLADALSRLRNVRRAGRHLHYSAYAKLITGAGKSKQANLIQEILAMARADVPFAMAVPSVKAGWISILDSMIAAALTVGDRQLAAKVHQDLLDMGSVPSANTFGIYITTLEGTFDEATEAVKIFQRAISEGVAPSVFLYNAVIGKLGKARRIDDCLRYFGEMQAQGIRPSSVTYGTLVNALCRTSEESFAVEMFDEMEAAPNYRPRPAPYNSIIQYFLNTKRDRSKVLQYYERMKSMNIRPTSHTYKLLIEAFASLEPVDLNAAESLLNDMKIAGVQPESVHYGSLIHAKGCVLHDMAGARAVFDSVVASGSIRPTDNLYQNLLEAMVANHEVAKTGEILVDMARRRVSMTPYIANTLIHGWAGEGDIAKARAIYNELGSDKREPSTYEVMTRAFLSAGDHASANGVVQEMLRKGYPTAVTEKVLALVGGAA